MIQQVAVDLTEAVASLRGHNYLLLDGAEPSHARDGLSGFYAAADGRFVYLHCNFPNLRARNLAIMGAEGTRDSIAAAVARRDGETLETAIHEGGGCASFVRTPAEWEAHPHNAALATMPVLEIERIGDAPPEPLPGGGQPLSGIRAIDMTRVIAGPFACRTLSEHGAEVLKISRPDLPGSGSLDLDTGIGIGKRSTFLDLREAEQAERLRALFRTGDVFVQSYRPGTLAARGFGPDALAELRPGLVMATLSAWGHQGPWRLRRGYDTIVQAATGIAQFNGGEGPPKLLSAAAIDYIGGNLLAFGVMTALHRRATIGASWLVRVSLAGTGHWMRSLGLVGAEAAARADDAAVDRAAAGMMADITAPMGRVSYLRSPLRLLKTPPSGPPVVECVGRRAALAMAAMLGTGGRAMAQAWPDRAVRLVVPFAPGGNVDRIARVLAATWSARLGQSFVVENRAGGGGSLGAGQVEQARPDGTTLMAASDGAFLLDPRTPDAVSDPLRRFTPIGLMSRSYRPSWCR